MSLGGVTVKSSDLSNGVTGSRVHDVADDRQALPLVAHDLDVREGGGSDLRELLLRQAELVPLRVVEEVAPGRVAVRKRDAEYPGGLLWNRRVPFRPELWKEEKDQPDHPGDQADDDARLLRVTHAPSFARLGRCILLLPRSGQLGPTA